MNTDANVVDVSVSVLEAAAYFDRLTFSALPDGEERREKVWAKGHKRRCAGKEVVRFYIDRNGQCGVVHGEQFRTVTSVEGFNELHMAWDGCGPCVIGNAAPWDDSTEEVFRRDVLGEGDPIYDDE